MPAGMRFGSMSAGRAHALEAELRVRRPVIRPLDEPAAVPGAEAGDVQRLAADAVHDTTVAPADRADQPIARTSTPGRPQHDAGAVFLVVALDRRFEAARSVHEPIRL